MHHCCIKTTFFSCETVIESYQKTFDHFGRYKTILKSLPAPKKFTKEPFFRQQICQNCHLRTKTRISDFRDPLDLLASSELKCNLCLQSLWTIQIVLDNYKLFWLGPNRFGQLKFIYSEQATNVAKSPPCFCPMQ